MDKVKLGRTGLDVPVLSLGGLFVSSIGAELEQAREAVTHAVASGLDYIDTAPGYGNSEDVLGKILPDVSEPYIISTKLGKKENFNPQSLDDLKACFEGSLKRLGRDSVDILFIHEPERPGQYDWWSDQLNVEGPVLDYCQSLKEQGVIKAIGLGGTTAYEMARMLDTGKFDVVLTAFQFNLFHREAVDSVFVAAKKHDVGVVLGSPLHQGTFSAAYDCINDDSTFWLNPIRKQQFKDLYAVSKDSGISVPEMAMRFTMFNENVHTTLTGSKSAEEVDLNIQSWKNGPLSEDIMTRIDEIAERVPYRPSEEGICLGWRLRAPEGYKGPGHA